MAPLDSAVRAIRSGRVLEAESHRGMGWYVELEHRKGLRSIYGHMARVSVKAGARVRQGQVIGAVGKTGNARHALIDAHLHLEVWRDGVPVDPKTIGLRVRSSGRSGGAGG